MHRNCFLSLLVTPWQTASPSIRYELTKYKKFQAGDHEAIPAILTFVLMPLSFSIATGLACGFVAWIGIKLLIGKWRRVHGLMYLVFALSVASLAL